MTEVSPVADGPILLDHRPRVAFGVGGDGVLTCRMQAYPRPNFQWLFGDTVVGVGAGDAGHYDVNVTQTAGDVYTARLTVRHLSESDYGAYTCKAWNSEGENAAGVVLQPTSAPETPADLRLVEAGYDSVSIEWDKVLYPSHPIFSPILLQSC